MLNQLDHSRDATCPARLQRAETGAATRRNVLRWAAAILVMAAGALTSSAASAAVLAKLYVIENSRLYVVSPNALAAPTQLGNAIWAGATSMASSTGPGTPLYVIKDRKLWSVNPTDGGATRLPGPAGADGTWVGDTRMVFWNTFLLITESGHLWRVAPSTGSLEDLGGGWDNTTSMSPSGGRLLAIQASQLWTVDPVDGFFQSLGTGWGGPTQMATASDGGLYVIQANYLFKVNSSSGSFTALTNAVWNGATSMTRAVDSSGRDVVYIIKDSKMWTVAGDGSTLTQATGQIWPGPTLMTAQWISY